METDHTGNTDVAMVTACPRDPGGFRNTAYVSHPVERSLGREEERESNVLLLLKTMRLLKEETDLTSTDGALTLRNNASFSLEALAASVSALLHRL